MHGHPSYKLAVGSLEGKSFITVIIFDSKFDGPCARAIPRRLL
jgi:hypothetical protein